MICPRCAAAQISPVTHRCEVCGFKPEGGVAVSARSAPDLEALEERAKTELAHRFTFDAPLKSRPTSVVYLAREPGSDRLLALKVVPRPDDGRAEMLFQRVIAVTGALDHPNIVPVHSFGTSASLFWYTMPSVPGRSLREVLRDGPMERSACLTLIREIGSALDYAHRRGVVHGNLKPENVIVDASGRAHVCDFGVAFAVEGAPAEPAAARPALRRPAYVAPEAPAHGMRPPSVDQYALAVIAYECLQGKAPPAGAPLLSDVRKDIPLPLAHAIGRAMSEKPAARFAGVREFMAALGVDGATLTRGEPTDRPSGAVLTVPDWEPPEPTRPRWLVPALALVAVVAVFGLWRLTFGGRRYVPLVDTSRPPTGRAAVAPRIDTTDASPAGRPGTRAPRLADADVPASDSADPAPVLPRRRLPRGITPPRAATSAPAPGVEPAPPRTRGRQPAATDALAGRLFVNATPWGELYLDGRLLGNTPKANLEILPGTHRLRIVRDGFEPYERTIEVAAGATLRITDIVLTERRP